MIGRAEPTPCLRRSFNTSLNTGFSAIQAAHHPLHPRRRAARGARPRSSPPLSRSLLGGRLGSLSPASAQSSGQTAVYYGKIDETLRTDLVQWSAHYWDRVDTGNTVKVGDFKFTDPALNTPLFNPARAVRPTLEQLKLVSTLDCDGVTVLTPGFGNAAIANSFRQAMSEWKLTTDSSTNASGTAIHMNLITSAPAGSGTTWEVIGNEVISTKLPWAGVAGVNTNPTIAPSISTSTQAAIDKLITVGSIIAAASEGISEAQSLITGQESHATKFERGVQQLLIEGGWNGTTWRVDAAFGVFGSLPLVGVTFDDAFVLLDAVNGNVDGPFALTSPLNAASLLAAHSQEYVASQPVRFFSAQGCQKVVAASWRPSPPSWGSPPWGPPSWFLFGTNYFCTLLLPAPLWPRVDCSCIREGTSRDGDRRAVRLREVCICTSCAGTGTAGGPPSGTVPTGGVPPTPAGSTCTCVLEYFH